MTEAEITDIFGPRCAVFNARCGSCLMWRAHDEYAALVAAARPAGQPSGGQRRPQTADFDDDIPF